MNAAAPEAVRTRRGRRTLLLIFALFFGPILLALVLGALNLHPAASKNKGERLAPYADLRALTPQLASGGEYRWNPEQRLWRIAVVAPVACAAQCDKLLGNLDKVRQLFGRDADRVQILWLGTPPVAAARVAGLQGIRPDPALLQALPRATGADGAAYVIDPYGFAVLRYAPGFDPADLRRDLSRLLKVM